MKWAVILSPGTVKQYKKLPEIVKSRVRDALNKLSEDPWGLPFKKLRGRPFYRIRVGNWRVVYNVDESKRRFTW